MNIMQPLIERVDRALIENELTNDKFIRKTNNCNNHIYIITHENSPHVMREISRLRELTFRHAGGGTGKECDIDVFDTVNPQYYQMIVWHPIDKEIVGAYRFIRCKDSRKSDGSFHLATSKLFNYSEEFINEYLPVTIELGRSFVQPLYQQEYNRKGIFSLANLWDGLGAIIVDNPNIQYFFGKMTMYPHFNSMARDMLEFFLQKYFPDNDNLVRPIKLLKNSTEQKSLENIFNKINYNEEYEVLIHHIRALNEQIPPLINAYMKLSKDMRVFGTAINNEFGDVYETGILINIKKIHDHKIKRHIATSPL